VCFRTSPAARAHLGYLVAVSGAELEERLDFRRTLGVDETPPDRLMILPIAPGCRRESFGGGRQDDSLQPPVVDVIVPRRDGGGNGAEGLLHPGEAPRQAGGVVPAASVAFAARPTR
jgi:hypothetical protein